jgi:hypothetical protein
MKTRKRQARVSKRPKDLAVDAPRTRRVTAGKAPTPGGPVPLPYPNQTKS